MSAIRLIVGLGNPGPRYEPTRHNVGANFVIYLARRFGIHSAMPSREANTYTVVAAEWILITKGGLQRLEEVFAG